VLLLRRGDGAHDGAAPSEVSNPLALVASLQMAAGFQIVLLILELLRQRVGTPGLLATAAVLGLTDVDALTLSLSRLGRAPDQTALAAQAIAVGILANTLLKLGTALVLGGPHFRRVAGGTLAAMATASAIGLWFAGLRA
jgi:uncharacterized membrane protein (DUF4010 family)